MTQEDIELLATDISARVKYGVQVQLIENEETMERYKLYLKPYPLKPKVVIAFINYNVYGCKYKLNLGGDIVRLEDCKPYLRPLSSMTEEEIKEFSVLGVGIHLFKGPLIPSYDTLDWLNAHHLDYRGLIEKGLALEAPEGMYNIKDNYGNRNIGSTFKEFINTL